MIVRCQLCNTPEFELTIRDDEVIIIVKSKHHGERHKSLIRIEELIATMKKDSQRFPIKRKGVPKGAVTATLPPTRNVAKSPFADSIPGLEEYPPQNAGFYLEPRGSHETDPFAE